MNSEIRRGALSETRESEHFCAPSGSRHKRTPGFNCWISDLRSSLLPAALGLAALRAVAASDPDTWTWNDPKEYRIPGLQHQTLESAAVKRTVGFCICLPPQYEQEPARWFPVVYFLH